MKTYRQVEEQPEEVRYFDIESEVAADAVEE